MLFSVTVRKEAVGQLLFQCKSQHLPNNRQDSRGGCHPHPPGSAGGPHRQPLLLSLQKAPAGHQAAPGRPRAQPPREEAQGNLHTLAVPPSVPFQRKLRMSLTSTEQQKLVLEEKALHQPSCNEL